MIPIMQRYEHAPPMQYGDCYRASLASILENDNFPDIMGPNPTVDPEDGEAFNRAHKETVEILGYSIATFYFTDIDKAHQAMRFSNPGIHYILSGITVDGVGHCVVCLDGEIVHNPHPRQIPIVGCHKNTEGEVDDIDEFCIVEVIVKP